MRPGGLFVTEEAREQALRSAKELVLLRQLYKVPTRCQFSPPASKSFSSNMCHHRMPSSNTAGSVLDLLPQQAQHTVHPHLFFTTLIIICVFVREWFSFTLDLRKAFSTTGCYKLWTVCKMLEQSGQSDSRDSPSHSHGPPLWVLSSWNIPVSSGKIKSTWKASDLFLWTQFALNDPLL